MKSKLLLTGILLSTTSTWADTVDLPEICKSAANYAAQAMALSFTDRSWGDPVDPSKVTLKKDFVTFPITAVKDLGGCFDDNPAIKSTWCQVAGGVPGVYQLDVARVLGHLSEPFATVVVTYNRGGCWVDQTELK
jgi:hypothetical protein